MNIKFNRKDFFSLKKYISFDDVKKYLINEIISFNYESNFAIEDISSNNNPISKSIVFIDSKNTNNVKLTNSQLVITNNKSFYDNLIYPNKILVKSLNHSYSNIVNNLFFHDDSYDYHDDFEYVNNSFISRYAKISDNCKISNNCVIGKGVVIGKNSIIKNNVVVKNSMIGDNVTICDNSTLGSTGFGFDLELLGSRSILPQIGIVYIDNNVHIGSGCTIDRGKIDFTYIGKNSVIDNQVHIAHNVIISDNACIAAQVGISGSVYIGKNFISGGQSAIAGHIKIGDNVVVAGKSGVTKNIKNNSVVAGFPAIDINIWKKMKIKEKKNGYK